MKVRQLRYQSTGKPIMEETPADEREERLRVMRENDPKTQRDRAIEQIASRREGQLEKLESSAHDQAVDHFDFAFKDVVSNPQLLREVMLERDRVIRDAAEKRQVIDWGRAYPEIGERVREKAGLPSGAQQEREGYFDELRKARGQNERG